MFYKSFFNVYLLKVSMKTLEAMLFIQYFATLYYFEQVDLQSSGVFRTKWNIYREAFLQK